MFNPQKTIELTRGGLTNPQATWESYLGESPTWQRTALELTVPLAGAAIVIGWLLSVLLGGFFYYGYGHGPVLALILALIGAGISVTVLSLVTNFFAGTFGGESNFDRAFTAVSLAIIPGWAGVAVSGIPFIGPLLQLAGTIVGLVFLYQIMPLALSVPENKRALHFIATIITVIVIQMILGLILGAGAVATGGGMQVQY
jgi:hypothetical protein